MATPAQVNKALKKAGLKVEIVRGNGYYWFADTTTTVPSLYEWPRLVSTPTEIIAHVKAHYDSEGIAH